MTPCSIGIIAHNDEANIGHLLEAILTQDLRDTRISEIIVVSSGSTDHTNDIVQAYQQKDQRIRLIAEPQRTGKIPAVNLFLEQAKEEICVLESADTIPAQSAIEHLVLPFCDKGIGMTGAYKMPVNASACFVSYITHLRLVLEHALCMEIPRLGELIAFRKIFERIPDDVSMDEAFIEAFVIRNKLRVAYAPSAIVYNATPVTLKEFFTQRRRNHVGHLQLQKKYGYTVSSLNTVTVARIAMCEVFRALRMMLCLSILAVIELCARAAGWYDFKRGKDVRVWKIAQSTKEVRINSE